MSMRVLLRHATATDLLPALELENGYIRVDREMRTTCRAYLPPETAPGCPSSSQKPPARA